MTPRERPPARSSVASTAGQAALGEYIDERVMAAILHSSLSAITALDGDGRIVFANPAAERVLRLEMAALSSERYDSPRWRLRHLDGRPLQPEEMPFRRIRDRGEMVEDQRFEIEHTNGDVRILEIRGVPLNDEAGNFRLAVFGLEDVTDQMATTEELRRTHELYRSAIQNADAMVYVLNFESGRYEVVSPGMAELLGSPPEACYQSAWKKLTLGWRVLDLPDGLDGDAIREQFCDGRLDRLEFEIEVLDPRTRRRRWFRDCSMPIRAPGRVRVERSVGLLIDVSRGRQAEARLAETHDLYRRAISNANAMLYVLDVATRRYEVAPPEFAALLGRPAKTCGLDDWSAIVEEATLQNAPEGVDSTNVWQHILSGGLQRVEYESRVRDATSGRTRWFRDVSLPLCNPDSGQVDRVLGLLFDITEVREARDRLAEVHELYRSAIHNAGAMFYVFNLETLDYDMASPEFAAMLGKPGQTCNYHDWMAAVAGFQHIHPPRDGPDRNLLNEMRAGQLDRVEFEVTVRDARTEQVRAFRDYAMPIRGEAGEPIRRSLGLLVDITPLHVARTQLEAIHDIYRRAIQNADAMLYVLNFRTLRYEVATPEFQRLLGKPLEECTKADWATLVRESHLVNAPPDVHLANVTDMLRTGRIDRAEFEVQIADPATGALRWFRDTSMAVREKGRPIERSLGLLIDVTRVHEAQAQLQEVHEIYRRAIANANGIPYLLNHRSRLYDYFGPGMRVVLGDVAPPVPSEALGGRVLTRQVVETSPPIGEAPAAHEGMRLTTEVQVACHDGQTRWFLDTSLPVRDTATGEVTGSLGILQDITERVRERRTDEVLGRMTTRLSGSRTPREAALIVLEAADELIDWDMGFLLTYDATRQLATAQVVLDRAEGGKREFPDHTHQVGPPGKGVKRAIDEGAYILSGEDLARARQELEPIGDRARRSQSLMFVPLMADQVCTGVLSLQSYRPDAFDAGRLALALRLAGLCAGAVARIEAEEAARLAQAQLTTAHEIYRRAILNANGIPYLLNFTTQEYEYAGPNIERLLGPVELPIPRARLLDRILEVRLIDPPGMSVQQLRAEIENRRLQRYIAEVRFRCHDGVERWFVDTALPMIDPLSGSNTRSLGILQDITERVHEKAVDIAMAQMGSRLGAATTPLEAARIVIDTADKLLGWDAAFVTLHDPESGTRDSLLIVDTIGGVRTEMPPEPFLSLSPGPAYARCLEEGGFLLNPAPDFDEGPERLTRFGDVSRPSQSLLFVPLVDQNRSVGVLSIQSYKSGAYDEAGLALLRRLAMSCSAAIARTQTAAKLRETESQLTALAESAPGAMFQFLVAPDGSRRLAYISPSVADLWGQPPAVFHNHLMRVLDQIHHEDVRAVLDNLEHAIAANQPFAAVFRLRHPAGEQRSIRAQARPGSPRPDGVVPWSGLMSDITSLREAEDQRRRLNEEIQNLDKLESLGLLAGGVAHDFNNLLSGVVANAALAIGDLPQEHPAREPLRQIEAASQRMTELAHQMLAYSGRGRFVNKVFDLGQLAGETIQLVRSSIPPTIQVHMATSPEPVWTEGDPSQIRQILLNLVTNAREAIGERPGMITLRTERQNLASPEDLPRVPWRDDMKPGAYVALSVEDTGHGMDEETMRRIFEPFFSTKFAGRGLGLAASQGILRAHGGAIVVRSVPGQGSVFTIKLPEAATRPDATLRHRERALRPAPVDARVLVVDDEAPVRHVLEAILRRAGVQATLCADGASALAHLADADNTVDAVLLDVTMPGMSGAEFYQKARVLRPRLPIVVMSGYAEAEVAAAFGQATLAGFLAKPFKPADVMAMVTRAIATQQTPTQDGRS